jgi:transcriptional regulator with XRE-family HTH domain
MYPNLKLQLWKCGIRQNRLAKMVEMDETALSRIVNGFREPSPELRASIAEVLRCDAAWLFEQQQASEGVENEEISGRSASAAKSAVFGKA